MENKIGIISDIHSNQNALDSVLSELEASGIDTLLCAGDITGYYVRPKDVIETFKEKNIDSVMGNHDAALNNRLSFRHFNRQASKALNYHRKLLEPSDYRYLEQLPETYEDTIDGKHLFMVHGSPKRPFQEYVFENSISSYFLNDSFQYRPDIIIMGHTHVPYVKKIEDSLVINPGSVGQPRDNNPDASYAVLDINNFEADIHRCKYDIEKTMQESRGKVSDRTVERLSKGR